MLHLILIDLVKDLFMRYANLFPKTFREPPREATAASHKFLYQGGFIRESTAGRYFFLPLGMRVRNKIVNIIREQMDKSGAAEMITPVLHPLELWKETNRTDSVGFELMTIADRRGAKFALGGTAEEMFVDVVRQQKLSYRDLPFNLYQFSPKFRDEMRARGGLLRVREFLMKDAYSFDKNEAEFKKEYENMSQTYTRIFESLGLECDIVESDNGYIGGEYCHEFVVESPIGESRYLVTPDGDYAAHEDVALFAKEPVEQVEDQELKPVEKVEAVRGNTMEAGVELHGLPLWQQIKDVLYKDEKGRFVLAVIRGDYDVNETKLLHLAGCHMLESATEDEIREQLQSEPGFISPVGIKQNLKSDVELLIVADDSLLTIKNMYGGSNQKNQDLLNVNYGRDYEADMVGDIALAQPGYLAADGKQRLQEKRGIEVGNIFQLGYHYSKLMNATFVDETGQDQFYYMGCYGIGVGRTLATIVEKYHDDKGIIWPQCVAPFAIHLLGLGSDQTVSQAAEELYNQLVEAGIEVLYDDRESVSAGVKFADADLLGIPFRLVVSAKTLAAISVEFKQRGKEDSLCLIKRAGIVEYLKQQI